MTNVNFDFKEGFVAYPEDSSGEPGRKAPYIDHGTESPDPRRYFSQQEVDLEWQHMWMKTWAFAGLMQDIPEVGDYLRYNLGKESFIVVRSADTPNSVKAFYNVCPHRGNRLVHNDFG